MSTNTVTLPTLEHRAPRNMWLTKLPARLTAEWIHAQYDALMAGVGPDAGDAAWIEAIRMANELESHIATSTSRVRLRFRQASEDPEAIADNRHVNSEIIPAVTERQIGFLRAMVASGSMDAIAAEFGELYRRQVEVECMISDPVNIPLNRELSDELMGYTTLFGSATVTWRGETLPISFARKAMHDEDTAERRAAHESVMDFVEASAPEIQRIFDRSCELRGMMARNLELDSYTEMQYQAMQRFDWGPADAAAFRAAVREHIVPLATQLRRMQAAAHGTELVHPADLEIWPDPAPELIVDIDEQLAAASTSLHRIGTAFGDPFDTMVREQLIDLAARPGKGTGAFCTSFPDQRVPYIFCNSVGSPDDVSTLLHEFGHALQNWRSADIELVQQRWPTLEACEIHSMTLELLAFPHMDTYFGSKAGVYCEQHLRATLLAVPYMAQVDAFQHEIYDRLASGEGLDGAGRNDLWAQLTREWRPGIDWDAEPRVAQLRWLQQLHIFHSPFYYLDYALARVVSWELWLRSLEDHDAAITTYLDLCSAGGTKPFRQLVLDAGLGDPFDPAVIANTVARLVPHLGLA
jgi:M3 family oligoendopeptidase